MRSVIAVALADKFGTNETHKTHRLNKQDKYLVRRCSALSATR